MQNMLNASKILVEFQATAPIATSSAGLPSSRIQVQ